MAESFARPADHGGKPGISEPQNASNVRPQALPQLREQWEPVVDGGQGEVLESADFRQETSLTSSLVIDPLVEVASVVSARFICIP